MSNKTKQTKSKTGLASSNWNLINEVKVESYRVLDMLDGRSMVVYMTSDGKVHQQIFSNKSEAIVKGAELQANKKSDVDAK